MTDRAAKKEKNSRNTNPSSKTNNEAVAHHRTHQSSQHHQSSQQKDASSRSNENDSPNDSFIKRYKIIEKIGEGSYSEVLKCQSRVDGSTVACKRLKHIYKSLDDVVNISEIATLRTIQKHSNILQMIEIHYDKPLGKVSLVFELMDINLYELIKDRKRLLPESRVRVIMFQLFRALRHLHKLGVFHRDIKPENILIKTKTDQLKLGDLGSVRGMFSRPPYTEYISTRWYRSPECLLTAGHYTYKMDIWAAGCVFYEVLTLRPLFPGSSEIDQINRINNILGPPPISLLETFHKQYDIERETYRGQSQLNRRQQIQKVLNGYSSRCLLPTDSSNKSSNNSLKSYRRNNMEFHFAGKEGTGLEKILPAHITREAKEIIKNCLLYDPEQRPQAQRVVQLSYFAELRESYNKNPEKIPARSVALICGDTVADHCNCIDLSTLGDHKVRYRRNISQKNTSTATRSSATKDPSETKASSLGSTDINNNIQNRRRSSSSNDNVVLNAGKGHSKGSAAGSKVRRAEPSNKVKHVVDNQERKSCLNKSSGTHQASRMKETEIKQSDSTAQVPTSKVGTKAKNAAVGTHGTPQKLVEPTLKKKQVTSSTSFDSVNSPESKQQKYSRQRDVHITKESKSTLLTLPDMSPYVKPPSELTFLRNKIKSDQHSRRKGASPSPPQITQLSQHPPQHSHPLPNNTRVAVVPPKVAAAAIKYAKVNSRKVRDPIAALLDSNTGTDYTESSSTNIVPGRRGRENEMHSAATDDTAYATASSVKIGKLRFRQANSQHNKTLPAASSPPLRSKIPVLTDDSIGQAQQSRKCTKLVTSPPEQRRETGTTDKWRNTGIPRRIPMSPERERNIQLLKESLTLDKDKRVKLQYKGQFGQDQLNNNLISNSRNCSSSTRHEEGGSSLTRTKTFSGKSNNYDYTSHDTLHSTREQQRGSFSSAGGGRYRNSTTDYENPDVHETSSASAAAHENQQRNIFNANTRNGRVVVPTMESLMKKPAVIAGGVPVKKSSELYPPEMLHMYSSRYRGPDTNMNILKDTGNNYVKRTTNAQSRTQSVKEKLNHKLEQRRHQREPPNNNGKISSGQQVGDQPSKLVFDRGSSYGHYSSGLTGTGEEEQFLRTGITGGRRPPLPRTGGVDGGAKGAALNKIHKDVSPETEQQYQRHVGRRRGSLIPTSTDAGNDNNGKRTHHQRAVNNAATGEHRRKDFKETVRHREEKLRNTMRDDVFCSSDDDVVVSMRKKFDTLISERARKLSDSLKTNKTHLFTSDTLADNKIHPSQRQTVNDSNSDDDNLPMSRRSRNNDKSRKHARRELRARMAESLTMNNFSVADKWRGVPEHVGQGLLDNRASNDSGDWVLPTSKYTNNLGRRDLDNKIHLSPSYDSSSVLWSRKNNSEKDFHENMKYQQTRRIHPFPIQEHQIYRRGQIFTPPTNKPFYQSTQVGIVLQNREMRYSHNNPMSVSRNYLSSNSNNSRRSNLKGVDNPKDRQQRM